MESITSIDKYAIKFISLFLIMSMFFPTATQVLAATDATTTLSTELRLIPTSITIDPSTYTAFECGDPNTCTKIQFRAVAHYNYLGGPVIQDREVTSDSLTVWSSSRPEVALVDTIGRATPVSDLNTGSQTSQLKAVYGGVEGVASLIVTGVVPTTPGGAGGGGSYSPPSNPATPATPATPAEPVTPANPETPGTPAEPVTPANPETPGTPTEPGTPANPETPGNTVTPATPATPATPGGNPDGGNGKVPNVNGPGSSGSNYLPLEEPVTPDQIKPVEQEQVSGQPLGISRAYVVSRIEARLNLQELRKGFYDKCYADLENCTNIFRMYSSYKGINLDKNNLSLFPDVDGHKYEKQVERAALAGVVSGYYTLENSPFLPDKNISNVEALKVMVSVISTLEKSAPGYVAPKFDFKTQFYQDVYVASLISALNEPKVEIIESKVPKVPVTKVPPLVSSLVKVAHAVTDQGWSLIRSQTVPFVDVRPDLYDSHWYYPIVYKKACAIGIIACPQDSLAKPDENPTREQIESLLDSISLYLEGEHINSAAIDEDTDSDGLTNLDENSIYLTDPNKPDTDGDGLKDGIEVLKYNTNPNKADSDGDGFSDGDEVLKFNTDPNKDDTDDDGFIDSLEIAESSDPLDAKSIPGDKNANRVSDKWELKFGVQIVNGFQDTDGDGLSDLLEYQNQTDPTKIDSDGDGYTDAEEILTMHSDPNDPNSPGDLKNLKVLINNFQYGQLIADPSPMIKGVGPASFGDSQVKIQILLRNDYGSEMMLGETTTDAKGNFIFIPTIKIKNGTYYLLARAISSSDVQLSEPLKIIVDSTLNVVIAKLDKIEQTPVTEESLVKDLVLKVDSSDNRPVLYGSLSEFGSKVNVTWQSLVVSSALVADATDGSFSIKAPDLGEGRHVVYIQTVRSRDNAMSKTLKINFDLNKVEIDKFAAEKAGISEIVKGIDVMGFVKKQSWPFWIVVGLVAILVFGVGYFFIVGRDDEDDDEDRK